MLYASQEELFDIVETLTDNNNVRRFLILLKFQRGQIYNLILSFPSMFAYPDLS